MSKIIGFDIVGDFYLESNPAREVWFIVWTGVN